MTYTYKYPVQVRNVNGRRFGHIDFPEEYLIATQELLLQRLGTPEKTVAVQVEINAPREKVWQVAADNVAAFFWHHPVFAGLSYISSLESQEGGRFIIHRAINGTIVDRVGEVLVNIPGTELTVSDLEPSDVSVSGFFPSLYTIQLEQHPDTDQKTLVTLSYTMLTVPHPWALGVLAYQANSIKHHAEQQPTASQ